LPDQQAPTFMPVRELVRLGAAEGLDFAKTSVLAPCAFYPSWLQTPTTHWCHQWLDCGTTEEVRFTLTPPEQAEISERDFIEAPAGIIQGNVND
jgi:hypothetical protein